MTNVVLDKQKIDLLANAIADKSGEPVTMTLDEMVEAVDGIHTGGIIPTGNITIKQVGATDVTNYATATVPTATLLGHYDVYYSTKNSRRIFTVETGYTRPNGSYGDGWVNHDDIYSHVFNAIPKNITITPTTSAQTIGGYDYMMEGPVTVAAMPTMTLPTAVSSTRSGTTKATIGRSTSAQYINIPVGYNDTAASYTISAVANGSATAPASISGTAATVSTGTNTLTLTKSVSVTPSVTAGYISSGTAGNSSVTLTANVTTKAAATITPGTTNQTITSGTYLTGTQTISGDANLTAGNIKDGVSIFGVTGSYTGSGGGITPTGNINITQAGVTDVTNYATATVPTATFWIGNTGEFYSDGGVLKFRVRGDVELSTSLGDTEGWIGDGNYYGDYTNYNAVPSNTHITPSASTQTVGGSNYMMQGAVTIDAIPTGTAGTPTATKGTVSNHSVSVTPSVTNTTGYITGSTKTGTAVTVSASELVSGSETKTANGTYDVTNLASLVVNVSGGANIATATMTNSNNQNTSISFTLPSGRTPKAFFARLTSQIARNSNSRYYYVFDMQWDGSSTDGVAGNRFYMSSGTLINVTSGYSYSQSGTTFTLSSTGSRSASPGSFYNGTYELTYVY